MTLRICRAVWLLPLLTQLVFACGANESQNEEQPIDSGIEVENDGGIEVETDSGFGLCVESWATEREKERAGCLLRINEVVSNNDGVWVDELGETDDYFEIVNVGNVSVDLGRLFASDRSGIRVPLPSRTLAAHERMVLWADDEPKQGDLHLPFKLSSTGDSITLLSSDFSLIDHVELPALEVNQVYGRYPDSEGAFSTCRYASAGRDNGVTCEPLPRPEIDDDVVFQPYQWPVPWPELPGPLQITEIALRPARFIEVLNSSDESVELSRFSLVLVPMSPDTIYSGVEQGVELSWPTGYLAARERVVVPVSPETTAALEENPEFEGALVITDELGQDIDTVDFARLPEQAVLARYPEGANQLHLCHNETAGVANDSCDKLSERDVGDRVHRMLTSNDFSALAVGGTDVGQEGVKFIVDMWSRDLVHFLRSEDWALHYTFARERIDGKPHLDRCDPIQAQEFYEGWVDFSQKEYFRTEGRRFLLGTLVRHANGAHTVEFNSGDMISAEQMRRGFFAVVARTEDPRLWALRAADERQIELGQSLEGSVPLVGPNAPYQGISYQPLSQTIGYGQLLFISASEIDAEALGPRTIVITDDVPNDIPFVGGLITEAFQTPLAHVNILSRARGTPNMALRDARNDERIAPLLGKLVRLDVGPSDFSLTEADPVAADAHWQRQQRTRPAIDPEFDTSVRGIVSLEERGISDLPVIGAKAAQFAELYRIRTVPLRCPSSTLPLNVPHDAFAIPVSHYFEHFTASGAKALLEDKLKDPTFRADPNVREVGLAAVRRAILEYPVDQDLLEEVTQAVRDRFGNRRVRFRSSSNTEDLEAFSGAGLHTSVSAQLDDPDRRVDDALRTVWASLWNLRAYDEREFANITQSHSAMGVLVHEAYLGEAAQGVGISRNLLHVTRSDIYYINAQIGEATVTNPAPGVSTEELLYTWPPRSPEITYLTQSSLTDDVVLSPQDVRDVACALGAIHAHFETLFNPTGENRLFAIQIEYKILRDSRQVVVKQARPQLIGDVVVPNDCREI